MTREEAELLIVVLNHAEDMAAMMHSPLIPAIADLRDFRTALLRTYVRHVEQVTEDAI